MSENSVTASALHYALSTWTFLLHVGGVSPADSGLSEACRAVTDATEAEAGNAAGEALVQAVRRLIEEESVESVQAFASTQFGDRAHFDLGEGSRDERTHRIRAYQFRMNLPWLARIWQRTESGEVEQVWMVVEQMTDRVQAMDPNPWNDIDEAWTVPVGDFHVLWELEGRTSIRIV